MDLLNDFALDPAKVENGVWCPIARGVEALICRVNNKEFRRATRAKVKANKAELDQDDDVSAELSDELMIEVYANTILKDIRVSDPSKVPGGELKINGQPFTKYTPKLGKELLAQDLFREKVRKFAEDEDRFRLKGEESTVND